jgi:cobaltochelatase CobN
MIVFLTNADTEILSVRIAHESLPEGFPSLRVKNPHELTNDSATSDGDSSPVVDEDGSVVDLEGVDLVMVRLLGGRGSWEEGFDSLRRECEERSIPFMAFGGEAIADAELTEKSSVEKPIVLQAFEYLVQGGPRNLANLLRFVVDTVLMEGFGFDPPTALADFGVYRESRERGGQGPSRSAEELRGARGRVAVVFYRAHLVAGNTRFVDDICDALEARDLEAVAIYCYSLRDSARGEISSTVELIASKAPGAVITTVLAAGSLDSFNEVWDPGDLASLDVPVIQAVCSTGPRSRWLASSQGLAPIDVAMSVAIPEFDGRVVGPVVSFKEQVDDGESIGSDVVAYRSVPDRVDRIAELAGRMATVGSIERRERRIAIVLSAYPTKRSRLGNAVGLDTPASVLELLSAMREAGYLVDRIPASGDELMAELADTLTYDRDTLDDEQVRVAVGRWGSDEYERWYRTLPEGVRCAMEEAWGRPPGSIYVSEAASDRGDEQSTKRGVERSLVFSGLDLGGVVVAVQPPRGFGENPVAIYHSPDLPPTHHYLGFYRWLDECWGADAIVHVGKHGTLEWLPGKGVGLTNECFPDIALGSTPLIYPFVVNDPGEGTQAKRRTHAVIVDHLVPPLTTADVYDDLARLEALLDDHARVAALDPTKLAPIREKVWEVMVESRIHQDLGLLDHGPGPSFEDPAFDDLLLEVDGYLCELKDAQIRGGLHTLGVSPSGQAELDMVAAICRLPQGGVGSLRDAVARELGVTPTRGGEADQRYSRKEIDRIEQEIRRLLEACRDRGWKHVERGVERRDVDSILKWVCDRLVPALHSCDLEIRRVLDSLDGRFVPPGPSGAPSRGMAHVLPTGRNFYSIDPKSVPTPLAWDVGQRLAAEVVSRHVAEEGRAPTSVALVVWGTSVMRTGGDDVAEALALLGVRPVWSSEAMRVSGVELVSIEELKRPRVDVTLRISGFFRDAFPHVVKLFNDAVDLVRAAEDESELDNPLLGERSDDPRVYGPKPGSYGSGILNVIESRDWRGEEDLAEVYMAWGGWAYRGRGDGEPAPEAFRRRLAAVEVAVKNQDNREHDIFDSDDYLQDHGGMIAAIRVLSGRQPKAWFGDSADPAHPRVRSLSQEAARVVRTRVINPKWLDAMRRHGYKGAFEMAATVDYLFGYDATAGVVEDWMYERVTSAYVGDPKMRKFFKESNPWALGAISERLLEAAERGLWNAEDGSLELLRSALLESEGWEEDR